ncbi:MAG: hypothetical protein FGF51_07645 [Candidatus Brockarchaeota archaeon]|nr:hypothetical protein [Candidatus Brockarchaeota archaeon]MBO3810079.1 hypothetical protein [Candidatus Brockarchaeota archaeon]MBO3833231.1 hypothetical protein [Candidatus Brockarchaeota archaeon]
MGKITDLNVTGLNPAKHAALLGDAHEMIVAGILIRLGFDIATTVFLREWAKIFITSGILLQILWLFLKHIKEL